MDELIRQVRAAMAAGLYYVALVGVLAIPDICGALASNDGKSSGSKYKRWLKDNVPEQAADAELVYGLRCSLLHQGQAHPHGSVFPMAFCVPPHGGTGGLHNLSTVINGQRVGWSILPLFVDEVTRGADAWFKKYGNTNTVQRNMTKFAYLRMNGLPPHVAGMPVFA